MKYLFLILVVLFLSGCSDKVVEKTIPKPVVYSVVYADGRTYCEKIADMNFSKKWDSLCALGGKDDGCELKEWLADSVNLHHTLAHEWCQKGKFYNYD